MKIARTCCCTLAVTLCAAAASSAHGRSLLYYYDFDKVENGALVYTGVNKGTGALEPTFKQNGSNPLGFVSGGALGSGYAFSESSPSSLWLGDGSASLGCGTDRGFTISFWVKANSSHNAWSDFFCFRLSGVDYRMEYIEKTSNKCQFYYYPAKTSATNPLVRLDGNGTTITELTPGAWKHVAIVATPNGTTSVGTCSFYVDGKHIANIRLFRGGNLQQLHIGSWIRQQLYDNNDRVTNTGGTCLDELALFDYPATDEQVKWLAKYKPAQPVAGPGREMPYCWHFDTTNATFGATAKVNSGTGTAVAFLWGDEKENNPGVNTTGYITAPTADAALGTAYAMNAGTRATWRIYSGAGLGATVGSGFTFSLWMRGNAKPNQWSDCFTFGVGGRYIRYEFDNANPAGLYFYGGSPSVGPFARKTDTWQHYCAVWNDAEQKIDYYMDGVLKGSATYGITPDPSHVVNAMLAGRQSNESDGTWRLSPRTAGMVNSGVFVDEVALYNYSLSPEQIQWLTNNVPCLPPLDATNLVRTVSANGAWAGGLASWTVREWDDANEAWTSTTRTTIYPALEDTEAEVAVTLADGVELTNDTFVTPKKLVLAAATSAALPVSATLKATEGSRFAPEALEVGEGLQLTVPLYAVNVGGTLTLGAGSKIIFDVSHYYEGGTTNALTVGSFALPAGESDVLAHFATTDPLYTLSLSGDGKTVVVTAATIPVTATWTGEGDGVNLNSAANWQCRNASGAVIPDAFPCEHTRVIVCSGSAALNAPVGTTIPWQYLRIEAGNATLAADSVDWRGLPSLTIPEGVTVNLGGNKLFLNETVTGRGTFTDNDATGGELHFDIADGVTFTNEANGSHATRTFALTGTLKLVKDGTGIFVSHRAQSYAGGTLVAAGTIRPHDAPAQDNTTYSGDSVAAFSTNTITVVSNAVFDVRGNYAFYGRTTLAGGVLANSGPYDMTKGTWGGSGVGRLTEDSSLSMPCSLVFESKTGCDLGGHTLTVPIGIGKIWYVHNTAFTNGMINITSGGWLQVVTATDASSVDFKTACALRVSATLAVHDFEPTYDANYNDGTALVEVHGTFKPAVHNYFHGCKMMDGSTIDFSSRTNALPLVAAFTSSAAKTLTFETDKTVYVKFGGYSTTSREPIISWTAKPANIDTVKFKVAPGERPCSFVKKDDGLYIMRGITILVR